VKGLGRMGVTLWVAFTVFSLYNLPLLLEGRDQRRDVGPKLEALQEELLVLERDKDSTAQFLVGLDSARYYPMSLLLRLDALNYKALRYRAEWIKQERCGTWMGACSTQPPRGR